MFEIIVASLTFLAVICIGGAVLAARVARREPIRQRLRELQRQQASETVDGGSGKVGLVENVGTMVLPKGPSAGLKDQLARAGFHDRKAPLLYIGCKMILFAAGIAGFAAVIFPLEQLSLHIRIFLILWGAGALTMLPNMVLRMRRAKRLTEIQGHLPDAIDLIEISVSAGMGLDTAWNSVSDQIRDVCPTLADEMALTNLEIHLGADRAAAMRNMVDRTGALEIGSLVSVLVQSQKLGTKVSDALRKFATSMREQRSARAEEAAEKMPVKLLFPLVLLIFPAVLIVLAGPAAIKWFQAMSGS